MTSDLRRVVAPDGAVIMAGGGASAAAALEWYRSAKARRRKHAEFSEAKDEIAIPGKSGDEAEKLLDRAKAEGVATLHDVTRAALRRIVRENGIDGLRVATNLYNEREMAAVKDALAAVRATSELLGRARVREQVEKHRETETP